MLAAVGRRLFWAVPNAILITAILFFCVAGLLGNPAALMLGRDATPQAIAELSVRLGFDRPLIVQYLDWVGSALRGDFGRSYSTHQTVAQAILPRLPVTLEIGLFAIALATVTSVVFSSIRLPFARAGATALAIFGITVPNFALGLALIFVFSVGLGWLPTVGWSPWSQGVGLHFTHIAMPVITLSAYYYGSFTLVYQAEYDSVRKRLFTRVAKAKGLSEWQVSSRHVLPNSILPVITYVGISLGQLMGGAVVTETLFSIPGIGSLFVDSIMSRDYPVMLAIGMIVIVTVVVMNTLADLVYVYANPQIRIE
jgi:peptide/nickel transport system permease protein